jgi:class 3 adenylate cyclase
MPALSFKTKLLLAMFLTVIGVTGATLYIAEKTFQEELGRMSAELFELQNKAFAGQQELFVSSIKENCRLLAKSVRLQNALSEVADDPARLYEIADGELKTRDLLATGPNDSNPFHAKFCLFLSEKGEVIEPPRKFTWSQTLENQERLKSQFAIIGKALPLLEEPTAGYITPQDKQGRLRLEQAMFTRITDAASGDILGALALGFSLPSTERSDAAKFKNGIFLEDRIYSQSIPEVLQSDLARRLIETTKQSEHAPDNLIFNIGTDPHLVFYQLLNREAHFPKAYLVALVSIGEQLQRRQNLRHQIFIFGGLGLLCAFVISRLLSHGLSVPIEQLVKGTAEIQRGNFSVKVPVRTRDEIGRLAASFNEMAEGLALKEKYRSVLNMVADKQVAHELMQGNVALGGEMRQISVLFCDIRGFTPLTLGMDPAEVIRMLNEHFTPLTRVVYEHNGVVDKFVGDLIMAVFGAPKSYGNDTYNAARCALDMIREREKLNKTSHYNIHIGIGVASGAAVAGCMGSNDRLNYTVLGERVNLASRLCGKAGRMEVVIDQTTQERLQGLSRVESLPQLELKGFSGQVSAYKLLELASEVPTPRT